VRFFLRPALTAALLAGGVASPSPAEAEPRTHNTVLVGHHDLGGEPHTAEVWTHAGVAYVGSWGMGGRCPGHGVRAVDITNPATPELVGAFAGGAEFPGTTSEDVWAGEVDTAHFSGVLAVTGIQVCEAGAAGRAAQTFRGLALYDLTDAGHPQRLGTWSSGPATRGVHELGVAVRPDGRVLVIGAVSGSLDHTGGAQGDVRIVDVTDPRAPTQTTDWDFRRDAPEPFRNPVVAARGAGGQLRAHSAHPYADGMSVVVSHWDAGAVFLDITDPTAPRFVAHTTYGPDEDGNAHSGWFTSDERYFVLNDETGPVDWWAATRQHEWGYQRVFDLADPSSPRQVATFATVNAARRALDGIYSVHNAVIVGDLMYASWFSDGVRVIRLRDVRRPTQVGLFVPPDHPDVHGFWTAPDGSRSFPVVWGVHTDGGVIAASDVHSGLWLFHARIPTAPQWAQ
jgi:hypothetical protein